MASAEAKTSNQSPRVMKQILQHANWPTGCNFGDPKFWPSGTHSTLCRTEGEEGRSDSRQLFEVDACRVASMTLVESLAGRGVDGAGAPRGAV